MPPATIESAEIKEKPRKKKKLNTLANPTNEISEKSSLKNIDLYSIVCSFGRN